MSELADKKHPYDIVIIGAGSTGLTAADFAVRLGARVALLEKHRTGGECTWAGCVPSKTLVKAAKVVHHMRTAGRYGLPPVEPEVDLKSVMAHVWAVVNEVYHEESPDALRAAGIDVYLGAARFLDPHTVATGDYGLVEKTQNTFEDCLTRVPFLVKPPAWVPVKPRVSDALVELIDFPATVEPLAGIAPGHTHFGRSLLSVLAGETDEHRDAVFCEGGRSHGETHCMELESTSNQNPQGLYWPRMEMQRSEGAEHTKAVMCRTKRTADRSGRTADRSGRTADSPAFKYVRRLYEPDELYDLRADPAELHNRIDDANALRSSSLADVLAQLKERLLTFYLETCDVVPHDTDRRG